MQHSIEYSILYTHIDGGIQLSVHFVAISIAFGESYTQFIRSEVKTNCLKFYNNNNTRQNSKWQSPLHKTIQKFNILRTVFVLFLLLLLLLSLACSLEIRVWFQLLCNKKKQLSEIKNVNRDSLGAGIFMFDSLCFIYVLQSLQQIVLCDRTL